MRHGHAEQVGELSECDPYPDAGEEADQHGAREEIGEQTQARDPSQEK